MQITEMTLSTDNYANKSDDINTYNYANTIDHN